MTKNRKLVLRDKLPEWAKFIDLEAVKANRRAEIDAEIERLTKERDGL